MVERRKFLLAFDADDTLWDNQTYFDNTEAAWCGLLSAYGSEEYLHNELYKTEAANMHNLGYGSKAFTISLIETALRLSNGKVDASILEKSIALGKELIEHPVDTLPGVIDTLALLKEQRKTNAEFEYEMVLFTKGDSLEQESKLKRSGLCDYFDDFEIVTTKGETEYIRLCRHNEVLPENLIMVGNSFKSDIDPVLKIGGRGIYIPFHVTWQFECTEEYEHPKALKLNSFAEIPTALEKLL